MYELVLFMIFILGVLAFLGTMVWAAYYILYEITGDKVASVLIPIAVFMIVTVFSWATVELFMLQA